MRARHFEYDTSNVSDDLATYAHVQSKNDGDIVALIMKVGSTEQKDVQGSGEPCLVVKGVDMDGASISPLRLCA